MKWKAQSCSAAGINIFRTKFGEARYDRTMPQALGLSWHANGHAPGRSTLSQPASVPEAGDADMALALDLERDHGQNQRARPSRCPQQAAELATAPRRGTTC